MHAHKTLESALGYVGTYYSRTNIDGLFSIENVFLFMKSRSDPLSSLERFPSSLFIESNNIYCIWMGILNPLSGSTSPVEWGLSGSRRSRRSHQTCYESMKRQIIWDLRTYSDITIQHYWTQIFLLCRITPAIGNSSFPQLVQTDNIFIETEPEINLSSY